MLTLKMILIVRDNYTNNVWLRNELFNESSVILIRMRSNNNRYLCDLFFFFRVFSGSVFVCNSVIVDNSLKQYTEWGLDQSDVIKHLLTRSIYDQEQTTPLCSYWILNGGKGFVKMTKLRILNNWRAYFGTTNECEIC